MLRESEQECIFAYGSNMNIADLTNFFCGKGFHNAEIAGVKPAILPAYRLVWNYYSKSRQGGAANVEPHKGASVPGLVLEVNREALEAIDRKEGNGHFYDRGARKQVVRLIGGGHIEAWVYVALPEKTQSVFVPPRRAYIDIMIAAAKKHALPGWHILALAATPVADEP